MSRKRTERFKVKRERIIEEPAIKKRTKLSPKMLVAISLVAIFFLVLFFNTYFNIINGVGINSLTSSSDYNKKYLFSGTDPYYNVRTINLTLQSGYYPWGKTDYILNYPVGGIGAARPPFMNMLAMILGQGLDLFLPSNDAIGLAMQFLPALFGALLVFPIYFIGKNLFNPKAGLMAALLVPFIPIHIASGHGSAFTLFDHDSLNLLLCTLVWLFYIKGLKSNNKEALLYGALTGVSMGALSLTWISAQFIYIILMICFLVQVFINILRKRVDNSLLITTLVSFAVAYLMYLPLSFSRLLELTLLLLVIFVVFMIILTKRINLPYIVSLPLFSSFAIFGMSFLYFFREWLAQNKIFSGLSYIADTLFLGGVYGTKTDLTIAEAKTFDFSRTVMSYGPAVYWMAWAGVILLMYFWWRGKRERTDWLFFITLFFIETQVLGIAGRFLNDLIPLVVVLAGWVIYFMIDKIDFKKRIQNFKAIGGIRGLRKLGVFPFFGILFIVFMVIMPSSYMAFDASVPALNHTEYFGEDSRPFQGLYLYKEMYWVSALEWLSHQDREIEKDTDRPAFISWWDYGFYESAIGEHPTVADNFQEGIPCAANFHTSTSEQEAVAVLSVRLLEGNKKDNGGFLSNEAKGVIFNYLPTNYTGNETAVSLNESIAPGVFFIKYIENPKSCPSYNKLIGPEYGNSRLRITELNAMYQDCSKILTSRLDDEGITQFYLDIENVTGYSIRYYGTEGYDMNIFPVFAFLSDKGTHGYVTSEDRYQISYYVDKDGTKWKFEEIQNMTIEQRRELAPFNTSTEWKDEFYQTFVYRTYKEGASRYKHFKPVYISDLGYPGTGFPAVVITKYYPGCYISGNVSVDGIPMSGLLVGVYDEYNLIHDITATGSNGEFTLLSVGGNLTFRSIVDGTLVIDEEQVNVSERQANRLELFNMTLDIKIQNSTVYGRTENMTLDEFLVLKSKSYSTEDQYLSLTTDGNFSIPYLIPGNYIISVQNATGEVYNQSFAANPGNNMWNLTVTDAIG